MFEEKTSAEDLAAAYVKPSVVDYGDLRELTAANGGYHHTDVPQNTPASPQDFS